MRVLITGAAGFLGRHFTRHHLAAGDQVLGIDDLSGFDAHWVDNDTNVEMDAGDWFLDNPLRRTGIWDIAYHFAAPVGGRMKIEGDPLFNADSLRLDSLFFRWACDGVDVAVYPSSSAVYGVRLQGREGGRLQEHMFHPENPTWDVPDEMYGFTKLAGETLAWQAAKYGLATLCIRPFSGYGEDQSLDYPVPAIADRVARGDDPVFVWGSGEQRRDFIHVDDVVGATIARLEAGIHGYQAMNIGSGHSTTFLEVAQVLARLADYEPQFMTDPRKPEGVLKRWSDNTRMLHYYQPKVSLSEGLGRVLRAREVSNAAA